MAIQKSKIDTMPDDNILKKFCLQNKTTTCNIQLLTKQTDRQTLGLNIINILVVIFAATEY